jgi:GT2 family glycosyltransferase
VGACFNLGFDVQRGFDPLASATDVSTPHWLERENRCREREWYWKGELVNAAQPVTVAICTRDRPDDLRRCLRSVLYHCPPSCSILVVDQSEDEGTHQVFQQLTADCGRKVTYWRSEGLGISLSRNEAAHLAGGGILLYTDDDCEVDAKWLSSWLRLLALHPECGIGFGRLRPAAFDPQLGFIPSFDPGMGDSTHGIELFASGADRVGAGANMALRYEAWADADGFDEALGPGTQLQASEDIDLALRVAGRGYRILHAPRATVVHHGLRSLAEARRLGYAYSLGTGAMYVRHLRRGGAEARKLLAGALLSHVLRVGRAALTGERPAGVTSLFGFVKGCWLGLTTELRPAKLRKSAAGRLPPGEKAVSRDA